MKTYTIEAGELFFNVSYPVQRGMTVGFCCQRTAPALAKLLVKQGYDRERHKLVCKISREDFAIVEEALKLRDEPHNHVAKVEPARPTKSEVLARMAEIVATSLPKATATDPPRVRCSRGVALSLASKKAYDIELGFWLLVPKLCRGSS